MHASAAGAKARRPLNAGLAVDMIVTASSPCESGLSLSHSRSALEFGHFCR
jgi:hypothetical protein